MARRRETASLTEDRKTALKVELGVLRRLAVQAEEDLKVHVFRAWEAGMSDEELAVTFGVHRNTIQKWRREGEQARDRRRGGGTDESGE